MIDLSDAANNIARRLLAALKDGKLPSVGIDEVRDAIAEETFPEELGAFRAQQLEKLTLRKLIGGTM